MDALLSLAATVGQRWIARAMMFAIGFWSIATIVSPFVTWKQTPIERISVGLVVGLLIALLEQRNPSPDTAKRDKRIAVSLVIVGTLFVVALALVVAGVQ